MNDDGPQLDGPVTVATTARKYGIVFVLIAAFVLGIFWLLANGGHLLSHAR